MWKAKDTRLGSIDNQIPKRQIMNNRSIRIAFAGLLMGLVFVDARDVSAQSGGDYQVDDEWAQLPEGTNWDGSTS